MKRNLDILLTLCLKAEALVVIWSGLEDFERYCHDGQARALHKKSSTGALSPLLNRLLKSKKIRGRLRRRVIF
jgi:hypothetical protein